MSNLLNKLRESKMEAAKRIGAIALAGALVVGGASGCANKPVTNNPNNPSIGGSTNSGSTNPGSNNQEETGKYSRLLMSVINDEYYKSVMSSTNPQNYQIPALDPHPYAFLEDQGIDVNKILDGTYKAQTMSFVYDDEPNNLYINTRVLVDDSYWHSFLVTYALSDKEMADYKLIHGNSKNYSYAWPAFFINDKISETKEPTKVLSTKYTKKTHEVFQKRADISNNQPKDYILPSIDISTKTYTYLHYLKHFNPDVAVEPKQMFVVQFKSNAINMINNAYEINKNISYASVIEKKYRNATTFDLQSATIFRNTNLESLTPEQ